jgi:Flp pilus assembly protein TadG
MLMAKLRGLRALARDRRGVSAVEFALLAPLMVGLYLGCAELSDGVGADRKVSLTAAALANLAAQAAPGISSSDKDNIVAAASQVIVPYNASLLRISVSCINIDANKRVTTKWTFTGGAGGVATATTVPTDLVVASTQLILADVTYDYTPTIGYTIAGTITLKDHMFMSPRISAPYYPDTAHPCS